LAGEAGLIILRTPHRYRCNFHGEQGYRTPSLYGLGVNKQCFGPVSAFPIGQHVVSE